MRASGFAALRTPLLAFDELVVDATAGGRPSAHRQAAQARLHDLAARPEVREAIYLASPSLASALSEWDRRPDTERAQRVELAVARYVARLATRPTPFATMAGTSLAVTGPRTRLVVGDRSAAVRATRPDAALLAEAVDALAAGPGRATVPLVANPTAYRLGGQVRWVERRGVERRPHLVAVEATGPVEHVFDRAATGARIGELVAAAAGCGLGAAAADALVQGLVERGLLVHDLGPDVTGPGMLDALLSRLQAVGLPEGAVVPFRRAADALRAIDEGGLGAEHDSYVHAAALLGGGRPGSTAFHVDLVKPGAPTVSPALLADVAAAARLAFRLGRRAPAGDLDRFALAFERRFGDREVALALALDPDAGVGFGPTRPHAPVLDGLALPPAVRPCPPPAGHDDYLAWRLAGVLRRGVDELVLDEDDVERLAPEGGTDPPPAAFSALVSIAAGGDDALDRGDHHVVLRALGGPSGAWLLGRFCGADPRLDAQVRRHLADEEALEPDAVFAEIVHLPEGPLGNVMVRPVLRGYEIPCLGRAGAAPERLLPLDDLRVSVRSGRVALWSERLGRRVLPRLTAAHDFRRRGLPLYRFLAALQVQGVAAGAGWRWGPLASSPFLPRVRAGRTVLSPARWRVAADEVRQLGGPGAERATEDVDGWRRARRLPAQVMLVDGDRGLLVDFADPLLVDVLVAAAAGRRPVRLEELLPGADDLCARGPEGRYVHELVVPFVGQAGARAPAGGEPAVVVPPHPSPAPVPPQVADGWLYARVFAGPATADALLVDVVAPLRDQVLRSGAADRWFFIRYGDPDWHLRLRFHGDPVRLADEVLPALRAALAAPERDGLVWKVATDSYEPELARFGGPAGMAAAEGAFAADSDAVLAALAALPAGDTGAAWRWPVALLGADALLRDFGLGDAGALALVAGARSFCARELRAGGEAEAALSRRFRADGAGLRALLDGEVPSPIVARAMAAFEERSRRLGPIVARLRHTHRQGQLSVAVEDVAATLVHLHLNRILRAAHRAQELVVYDTLARRYRSRVARAARP